ncbi:MAG TPA: Rid family detoxifying hydrolase [Terriglobia bacterium]|jgi:2-iminobutanoate/2-iminopropanoate deaminase|nr:Rid family detoxifying hydrolase [Terriglobia bacterium]
MRISKPDRRRFLSRAAGSAVVTGAATLAVPSALPAGKSKAAKKVIYKPGEQPSPETILSSAIQFGNLVFVSGAGAHDPKTHKVVEGPFPNQVRQCLENVKSVVEAAGSSMDRVLKCLVFLTDIANFQAMNQVYHTYFPTNPPARSTVAVKDLPGDSPIEIECIAYID